MDPRIPSLDNRRPLCGTRCSQIQHPVFGGRYCRFGSRFGTTLFPLEISRTLRHTFPRSTRAAGSGAEMAWRDDSAVAFKGQHRGRDTRGAPRQVLGELARPGSGHKLCPCPLSGASLPRQPATRAAVHDPQRHFASVN